MFTHEHYAFAYQVRTQLRRRLQLRGRYHTIDIDINELCKLPFKLNTKLKKQL
jgi:hypothetical protein